MGYPGCQRIPVVAVRATLPSQPSSICSSIQETPSGWFLPEGVVKLTFGDPAVLAFQL
jgi:hypothetical protein